MKPRLSVSELRQAIREERLLRDSHENPLPAGKYRILYADPPWCYGDKLIDGYGAAEHHYPSMTLDELGEYTDGDGKTVEQLASRDAVLFLWCTVPMLPEALGLLGRWGFRYATHFVWDKVKHNYGHYNSVRHELLLIGVCGSCTPDHKKLFDSVQVIERTKKHSQKPDEFRQIIETLYPEGRKLELFARSKTDGWTSWGNEAE